MKCDFEIEGKTLNIDLLVKIADTEHISLEEMSQKIGMGRLYLRNRRNENRRGIYRTAQMGVVKKIIDTFGLNYNDLVTDYPEEVLK